MRVAQIAAFYGTEISGAENSISLLLAKLREEGQGVDICVFSTRRRALQLGGYVIPYLDWIPPLAITVGNPVLDMLMAALLSRVVAAQGRFDLMHVQDVVCLRAAVSVARRLDVPLVATVRDPIPRSISHSNYPCLIAKVGSLLLRYQDNARLGALKCCAKVIAISDFVKSSLVSHGVAPECVETIYNPTGSLFTKSHTQRPQQIPGRGERHGTSAHIVAAGRLCREKGFHVLLEALPKIVTRRPDIQVTIAGTGPYENHLKDLAKMLDLDGHVTFVGQVSFTEMPAIYADAEIVIVPSVFTEPLGRTVLEAMAGGKAVIASAVGAIPELIEDRKSGLLVPPGNSEALSDAVLTLLTDHRLRNSIGENAKRNMIDNFDDTRLVQRVIEVYCGPQ